MGHISLWSLYEKYSQMTVMRFMQPAGSISGLRPTARGDPERFPEHHMYWKKVLRSRYRIPSIDEPAA